MEGFLMKLRIAAACAVVSLAAFALASSALAEGRLTATLQQPKPAKVKLIAAHTVWVCQDTTCVAGDSLADGYSVDACQDLVKQVGPVSAYDNEGRQLPAPKLAKCNTVAKAPATIAASR
jgi:hypothetical protein